MRRDEWWCLRRINEELIQTKTLIRGHERTLEELRSSRCVSSSGSFSFPKHKGLALFGIHTFVRTHANAQPPLPRTRRQKITDVSAAKTIFLPSLSPRQRRYTWHHIKAPQVNKRKMSTQDTSMFFFFNSWGSAAVYTRCARLAQQEMYNFYRLSLLCNAFYETAVDAEARYNYHHSKTATRVAIFSCAASP